MSEWVTESKRKQMTREVSVLFVDIAVVVVVVVFICDVITPNECIIFFGGRGQKLQCLPFFFASFFDDSNFGVM